MGAVGQLVKLHNRGKGGGELGPIVARQQGKPAMRPFWIYPYPAQIDNFIELRYECSGGRPETASSSIYQHPWSQHDYMGLAAELQIFRDSDDDFRVRLITYSWSVWDTKASPTAFERYSGCSVTVWDTHETFGQFVYAEAFAQFAWGSWRSSGTGGTSGMLCRDDLDNLLNPVPQVAVAG